MLGVDLAQTCQREGRPGTLAQQTFQAVAVVGCDAHRGVDREAPTVVPGRHGLRLCWLQQSAPGHHPQQAPAHGSLDGRYRWFVQSGSRVKGDAAERSGIKHAIDDDTVEVQMGVEQRAKAVDEDDRTEAGRGTGTGTVLPQNPLDGGKEDVQCGVQHCRVALKGTSAGAWARRAPTGVPANAE